MKGKFPAVLILAGMVLAATFGASASDAPPQAKTTVVTDENYSLAETDGNMEGYVKKFAAATNTNGVGVLMHSIALGMDF